MSVKTFEVTCTQVPAETELTRIVDIGNGESMVLTGWSALFYEIQQLNKKIQERKEGTR